MVREFKKVVEAFEGKNIKFGAMNCERNG